MKDIITANQRLIQGLRNRDALNHQLLKKLGDRDAFIIKLEKKNEDLLRLIRETSLCHAASKRYLDDIKTEVKSLGNDIQDIKVLLAATL
jgi:hypothetical protein